MHSFHIFCLDSEIFLVVNDRWVCATKRQMTCSYYRFSLSHDDSRCLFVTKASDGGISRPRNFSTCASCLRRMMSRGVLEARELRGASGDLWLGEFGPNSLLATGLTAYDTRLLTNNFSSTVMTGLISVNKQWISLKCYTPCSILCIWHKQIIKWVNCYNYFQMFFVVADLTQPGAIFKRRRIKLQAVLWLSFHTF